MVPGTTGYRLPTEAQWEYAAKGGNNPANKYTYAGSNDPDAVAWYGVTLANGGKSHEVGKKTANGLGLHDMSGNVWEWCWDWHGSYTSDAKNNPIGDFSGSDHHVVRGGGWDGIASRLRSVSRYYGIDPSDRSSGVGFRLVLP